MKSYVWITFGALALGYYELSGGSDFESGTNGFQVFAEVEAIQLDQAATPAGDAPQEREPAVTVSSGVPVALAYAQAISESPPAQIGAQFGQILTPLDASAGGPVDTPSDLAEAQEADLRKINGSRVNLRKGPGRGHDILAQLSEGTKVQVLDDPGAGWVQLQVLPEGGIGWVADYLLDES